MKIFIWIVAGAVVLLVVVFVVINWASDRPASALTARWAPPPSVFIDVSGMKVHVCDEGVRDVPSPIVLLHGTSASLHTWGGWVQVLKTHRRVIRFDLPGFGLTGPSPDGNYTIESYVRFVTAMLDRLGVQHCVLAGNPFGSYVAWATALA
jgi:pimeloyl-ACP methyl ester carboxylesterase